MKYKGIENLDIENTRNNDIENINKPVNERPFKGESLIIFPDDYIVLDLETTGFSPRCDEIIEIGALKIKSGKVIDKYSTLIKPNKKVNGQISSITGITNNMLKDAPCINDVMEDFINFVSDHYIVGHNICFDINFIYDNYYNLCEGYFSNDYIDTLKISRRCFTDLKNHKLGTLAKLLNINTDNAHRALCDCCTTNTLFTHLKNVYNEKTYTNVNSKEKIINKNKSKKNLYNKQNLADITTCKTEFDTSHPLYGKICTFSGTLDKCTKEEAAQIVVDNGGFCKNGVTKKTDYLIIGHYEFYVLLKDGKSTKQKRAEELQSEGYDIKIIPEDIFYGMIEDSEEIFK